MASAVNLLKLKRLIIIILSTGKILIKEYALRALAESWRDIHCWK